MPELTTHQSALLTDLALCVNHYRLFTPGIYVCVHVPVQLDAQTRVVPGLVSMVNYGRLKQCEPQDLCFQGPPNFVLDVFVAGDLAEYHHRQRLFERFGVTEYVAVEDSETLKVHWNRLDSGQFQEIEQDAPGEIRSKALPGLWIPTDALARRDWWAILAAIERGVTRRGHHEFMETILHKDGRPSHEEPIPFSVG
jgi:Putative restriction endonuclease